MTSSLQLGLVPLAFMWFSSDIWIISSPFHVIQIRATKKALCEASGGLNCQGCIGVQRRGGDLNDGSGVPVSCEDVQVA